MRICGEFGQEESGGEPGTKAVEANRSSGGEPTIALNENEMQSS